MAATAIAARAPAAVPAPQPMGRGTLGRRLVLRVTALVALVAILLSAATFLATRQLLIGQVDSQVDAVTSRLRDPDGDGGDGGPGLLTLLQPGNPIGTVVATFSTSGAPVFSGELIEGQGYQPPHGTSVSDVVVSRLGTVPVTADKNSLVLPGLGHYRVAGYQLVSGSATFGTLVVGVPLGIVDHTLTNLLGLAALLSLLAVALAVLAGRAVVARSLRPLYRVAATAQQVSQLPLDKGDVSLPLRVAPEDADPKSEVGRVGQALNHLLNNVSGALAARQASEMKVRRFVADASHELRNPLAAIRGYAELTRRDRERLPAEAAFAMSRVESETDRMSHLVEDLLLLARLDAGRDLEIRPTDLTELVINAASDARAAGPDHVWTLDLPSEPVVALGDTHRLHQVLGNLLANARTHTPSGTRVETGLQVEGDTAVITVLDDGPGIPPDIQGRVFERFTRADTSRARADGAINHGSTGLGLAIVAAVVDAHGGTVGVTSQPGRTEFAVRLPLARTPVP